MKSIGVLALQGDYARHEALLNSIGVKTLQIRKPEQLEKCSGLILPGGESTTLTKLMDKYGFFGPLRDFAKQRPVMGTCAGLIMLSSKVDDPRVSPLGLIPMTAERNAYGRQIDSFAAPLHLSFLEGGSFRGVFIRAPKIAAVDSAVEVLAVWEDSPIMVRYGNAVALSFHPELTDDSRVHRYFLESFSIGG